MIQRLNILCLLFLFAVPYSYGQQKEYRFKRELKGITEQWHSIALPDDIFKKLSADFSDIRIYGVTTNNDTVEVPYMLYVASESITTKKVAFNIINTSKNKNGFYFTFEVPAAEAVNQIELKFAQKNFDWRTKLEGSHNQQEWFTVVDSSRILSIKNETTDFHITKFAFPTSKYRYYRLQVSSTEKPELTDASVEQQTVKEGIYKSYTPKKVSSIVNRDSKQTEIDVELEQPLPVSFLKVVVKEKLDFYRPVIVKYLSDSTKTEHGWIYHYATLTTGALSSTDKNEYKFNSTVTRKLKILVYNQDNQPLTVSSVQVKGYECMLIARFSERASFFMVYGSATASKPEYDLERFSDKIPTSLKVLDLGREQAIKQDKASVVQPLFKSKAWLWAVMFVIMLLLGWFSVRMIKNK